MIYCIDMLSVESRVNVADNSGADVACCVGLSGPTGKRCSFVGDIILVSIKSCVYGGKVKKGGLYAAVIVRTIKPLPRPDGMLVSFSDNAVVLLDKKTHEPIGTRVMGPVAREVRVACPRVVSLASEVC